MSWPIAVIVIVAIVALAEVFKARHRAQHGITKDWMGGEIPPDQSAHLPPAASPELQREVEELRERVKVLERIATDPARRTAEEIEKLRDE